MNLRRALWATRPQTHRLAYYSFLAKKALHPGEAEIENDVEVEYKGTRFIVPKGFDEVFYSIYLDDLEPLTYRLMTKLTGEVFVDVGANVGGYSVRLGKNFRRVISVEPNPRAADALRRNVELNHLSNVQVVQKAISDTTGETIMSVPSSGKTTRSSIVEEYNHGSSFSVHTSTLDNLLGEYDRIDLVKVDAEGAEVRVLRGAENTLRKTSRLVLETGSWSERDIREILDRNGFKISDLDLKVSEGKNVLATRL